MGETNRKANKAMGRTSGSIRAPRPTSAAYLVRAPVTAAAPEPRCCAAAEHCPCGGWSCNTHGHRQGPWGHD